MKTPPFALNFVSLVGTVARPPRFREDFVAFVLEVPSGDHPVYLRVVAFDDVAARLQQTGLQEGDTVLCQGRLDVHRAGPDGQLVTDVVASVAAVVARAERPGRPAWADGSGPVRPGRWDAGPVGGGSGPSRVGGGRRR